MGRAAVARGRAELAFTTHHGTALDAANVRKMFKRTCTEAGIGDTWTPRELRTSFIRMMSHPGVSIEEIARLVGHATTRTPRSSTGANCDPSSLPAPNHGPALHGNLTLPVFGYFFNQVDQRS